jgi:hypothetical protein
MALGEVDEGAILELAKQVEKKRIRVLDPGFGDCAVVVLWRARRVRL